MKFKVKGKPADGTTFGPGGYTVYKVLTDTAGDVYYAPIADFKYLTDAKVFKNQMAVVYSKNKSSMAALKPWWEG